MSILARCGSAALLLSVFVGTAAFAQDAPGSSSSWTDPPARGAAGPPVKAEGAREGAKPDETKTPGPAAQAPAPASIKPVQRTAAGAQPVTPHQQPARSNRALAVHRHAVPTKRLATRPSVIAAAPAVRSATSSWGYRLRVAEHRERELRRPARRETAVTARHDEAAAVPRARRSLASTRIRRYDRDYAYATPYPVYARRAGWGELVGDDRAYRIAQARAAGYRVMRLRTYAYPGGRFGELVPYDAGGFD